MDRQEVVRWMHQHPEAVHGEPGEILGHCEREIRMRAEEEAWEHAKRIVDRKRRSWRHSPGNHASPGFAAREVCATLAVYLRETEPVIGMGGEERFIGEETRRALEPHAVHWMAPWIHDLAAEEEHRAWLEIVRFTKGRGASIARELELGTEPSWRDSIAYGKTAAEVTAVLSRDYAEHLHLH